MFANSSMMGVDTGFQDVCLTPVAPTPVPMPYPNLSKTTPGSCFYKPTFPPHNMLTSVLPQPPGVFPPSPMGTPSFKFMLITPTSQQHDIDKLKSSGISPGGAESLISKKDLPESEIDLMVLSGLAKKPVETFVNLIDKAKKSLDDFSLSDFF